MISLFQIKEEISVITENLIKSQYSFPINLIVNDFGKKGSPLVLKVCPSFHI